MLPRMSAKKMAPSTTITEPKTFSELRWVPRGKCQREHASVTPRTVTPAVRPHAAAATELYDVTRALR